MAADVELERFAPDAPFKYVGGDIAADFVNTVNWTGRGLGRDRLTGFGRLLEWSRGAGVTSIAMDRRLLARLSEDPQRCAAAFRRAVQARAVLQRLFNRVAHDRLAAGDLEEFNALLRVAASRLRVARETGGRLRQSLSDEGDPVDWILWNVVWAASALLASPDAERLRMCAGEDCGWFYVDRSRNGMRRWCEMSVCGTTEKNRRRALA